MMMQNDNWKYRRQKNFVHLFNKLPKALPDEVKLNVEQA